MFGLNLKAWQARKRWGEKVRAMQTPDDLLAGYRRFRTGAYRVHSDRYRALGRGQDPDVMLIACCDSRVEPAQIFNAAPGELFIVRNVANLVPPYEEGGGLHGVSAALEFGVTSLNVHHIVILGHGGCGGVAASLSAADHKPVGAFIAPWVELLDTPRDGVIASGANDRQTALEHAGIGQSLVNLMSFPFVRRTVESGRLALHGAWFAIASGELHWRDAKSGEFETVLP